MAKALKYPSVFRALLEGGHICEREALQRPPKFTVHVNFRSIGHITETQFEELYNADLLHHTNTRHDKSGAVLNYYELPEV